MTPPNSASGMRGVCSSARGSADGTERLRERDGRGAVEPGLEAVGVTAPLPEQRVARESRRVGNARAAGLDVVQDVWPAGDPERARAVDRRLLDGRSGGESLLEQ